MAAITDLLNTNWGPYSHTEVEEAIKEKFREIDRALENASSEGGIGYDELSKAVRDLLDLASTALQPGSIANWAKQPNKPGYTVGEIIYDGLTTLSQKLATMDAAIQQAAASGAVEPDSAMSDSSVNAVQNKIVKAYIDAVSLRLDTLIGSNNVQGVIDTFNEVKNFLAGIDTSDPTLFNQLKSLSDAITALQSTMGNKSDKNATVSGVTYDTTSHKLKQTINGTTSDVATVDTAPTDNSDNFVTSGGVKTALATLLSNITIGNDGYWYVGQTNTGVKAQGPKGNSVVDGDTFDIVNNLTDGGEEDALSAEMGKQLGAQVDALEAELEELDEGGYHIGVTDTAIVFTNSNMPYVSVGEVGNNNVSCKAGNTATTSFYVSGRKLTSAIQIAVSDATNFAVDIASISPTNGKVALTLVTITYQPAAGTTAGTTHNCNVVVSSGGTTFGTIAMVGTVAASPSITLTPSTLTINTTSGTSATATINVKGTALEGDITLAISGTGFSLSTNSVAKADAETSAGADVTVTFDGSSAGSATITASSTNATDVTASVSGVIPTPLAEGSYFIVPASNGNGSLKYTVLADGNVSVQSNSGLSSTAENPLVIPATVNDSNATAVYNSGGTAISASGLSYTVTEIPGTGNRFRGCSGIQAITLPNTLKTIGYNAFNNCTNLTEITIPASVTSITNATGSGNGIFYNCPSLAKAEFLGSVTVPQNMFIGCTALMKIILNGNSVDKEAFTSCTQFAATEGAKPVVVNRGTTYYNYRSNWSIRPFPQNESSPSKVWAKLYCDTSAGFPGTGDTSWGCFDEVIDINNYTE